MFGLSNINRYFLRKIEEMPVGHQQGEDRTVVRPRMRCISAIHPQRRHKTDELTLIAMCVLLQKLLNSSQYYNTWTNIFALVFIITLPAQKILGQVTECTPGALGP